MRGNNACFLGVLICFDQIFRLVFSHSFSREIASRNLLSCAIQHDLLFKHCCEVTCQTMIYLKHLCSANQLAFRNPRSAFRNEITSVPQLFSRNLYGMCFARCSSTINLMTRQTDRKPRHAAYKRQHKYEFEMQDERGWAGQHGQHPVTQEEESYRPQKESNLRDGWPDEDED